MRTKQLLTKTLLLLAVMLMGAGSAWADDQVTLWSEDFSSYSANDVPSGGTYSYVCADGGTSTKIYNEELAGGTAPELLVSKSNGTFTATVPLDNIEGDLTLTFKTNNQKIAVSTSTKGISGSLEEKAAGDHTLTFTGVTTNMTQIVIEFKGSGSSNVRLDNIVLKGTKSSGGGDTPTIYTVTYDRNGATSGDVPTDNTKYDADNNTVTVLGNTGNLAKEHYTFTGWNTAKAGTGTGYVEGNTFTISANTTLYAQWAINTNTVTLPDADQYGTYAMSATNPVAYGTEVTLTYTPAEGYEKYVATWSVNDVEISDNKFTMPDEAVTITVSLKKVLAMAIDFESDASVYSDWTFTNLTSKKQNSGVTVHGGLYMGVTNGTATASIQTKEKVSPDYLTCYVSKQTTNTSASTWYIQVSSDGSAWTDVESIDGASMSKGEWKELTADLSSYSDVYVRVYYSGSTAVRCIDDLLLVLQDSDKPSISASDVNIAYDATSGSITYTLGNEPDPAGTLAATITAGNEGDWLTVDVPSNGSIALTCSANEANTDRTATVTLTYTYGENQTVTKDVAVTQAAAPIIYTTIPALFEAATNTAADVNVTFGNWVVSGISTNGKSVFVTDGTNGFVIYSSSDQSSTYTVGDILSGTASCSLKLNTGFAQITDLDANDLTITTGGTVSTANIALDALAGVNTGALVSYTGLTCSVSNNKYYLSDGTTTIQLYNSLYNYDTTFEDGKTYNITGIYQQYNTTKEILPRSAADIVEVVVPTISLSETAINATASEKDGTITVTYNNLTNYLSEVQFVASDGETAATYDWLDAEINSNDDTILDYTIGENTSTEVRKAYMKVYAVGDEGDAYSDLITITQAAPVVTNTYTLATTITSGKHYVIASGTEGDVKVMGAQNTNNRSAVNGTVTGTTLSVASDADATEFVIYGPDADGFYTIYDSAKGYLFAASSSNNWLRSQTTNDANGKWSISIDGSGKATVVAQGSNTNKYMRFNSTLFSCYGSSTSVKDLVYFFEKDGEATPTETVTISDAKYATYYSENALDFTDTGVSAYVAKRTGNGSTVNFIEVKKVPALTGMLLKANAAGDFTVPSASTVEKVANNALIGVLKETTIAQKGIYVLMDGDKGVGFYKTSNTGFKLNAHTAYIGSGAIGSRSFIAIDEATGIDGIAAKTMGNGEIFNLQGQRVTKAQKGLYIMDGKKVVMK